MTLKLCNMLRREILHRKGKVDAVQLWTLSNILTNLIVNAPVETTSLENALRFNQD
jgi:hypothetical protein